MVCVVSLSELSPGPLPVGSLPVFLPPSFPELQGAGCSTRPEAAGGEKPGTPTKVSGPHFAPPPPLPKPIVHGTVTPPLVGPLFPCH